MIRLDARTACGCPGCVLPPPEEFTAALLVEAVKDAAATVAVACPPVEGNPGVTLVARWGSSCMSATQAVSERLGHANIAITMDTYSHVLPGLDEQAAGQVARFILGAGSADAS